MGKVVEVKNVKHFFGIERPLPGIDSVASLDDLIFKLHIAFATDSAKVDHLKFLMQSLKPIDSEWRMYAKFDQFRYTRNLVDTGNEKFNLILLCWGPGHGSPTHDHAEAHCIMKMMKGGLREIRYENPKQGEENQKLKEISRSVLDFNEICYINDDLGLHRVENASKFEVAVSLHLYCPPFDTCSIFTGDGKRSTCQISYHSVNGEKLQ
jgi:cysteine dioxygenase